MTRRLIFLTKNEAPKFFTLIFMSANDLGLGSLRDRSSACGCVCIRADTAGESCIFDVP